MKLILILALATTACGGASRPAPAPAPASIPSQAGSTPALPRETHWFRNSAEYRAAAITVYRAAEARVTELARNERAGTWAVILDADETVLDNSEYQRRLAANGGSYSDASWNAWVNERTAPAIPGAIDFISAVRRLGGRVAIVSNRDDVVCDATRDNLRSLGIPADVALCRINRVSDKNPRFEAVQQGTTSAELPPLRVLLWVGDNIQDFPLLMQNMRGAPATYSLFGDRYFMLPNPMYGSWENNPKN